MQEALNDAATPPETATEQYLVEVLMRLVSELHDVAALVERLEPQLLEARDSDIPKSPDSMKMLQGIDLALQKTRGLAEFIHAVAGSCGDNWTVDIATALNLVKLTDMRAALAGGRESGIRDDVSLSPKKSTGDLDLF